MSEETDKSKGHLAKVKPDLRRVLGHQKKAEYYLEQGDVEVSLNQARKAVEAICKQIYINEGFDKKSKSVHIASLEDKIKRFREALNSGNRFLPKVILAHLSAIRDLGNLGSHDQGEETGKITSRTGSNCLETLSEVVTWFCEEYHNIPLEQLDEKRTASNASGPDYYQKLASVQESLPDELRELFDQAEEMNLVLQWGTKKVSRMVKSPYKVLLRDEEGQRESSRQFNFGVFRSNGFYGNNSCEGVLGQKYLRALAEILPDTEVSLRDNEFNNCVVKTGGERVGIADLLAVKDAWLELIQGFLPELEANKVED